MEASFLKHCLQLAAGRPEVAQVTLTQSAGGAGTFSVRKSVLTGMLQVHSPRSVATAMICASCW